MNRTTSLKISLLSIMTALSVGCTADVEEDLYQEMDSGLPSDQDPSQPEDSDGDVDPGDTTYDPDSDSEGDEPDDGAPDNGAGDDVTPEPADLSNALRLPTTSVQLGRLGTYERRSIAIRISNVAPRFVDGIQISVAGSGYTLRDAPVCTSIDAESSCSFAVDFSSNAQGYKRGIVTVDADVLDQPLTLYMHAQVENSN